MYSIHANLIRLAEFQTWLNERGLVQGQDYTFTATIPGWNSLSFQREEDLEQFSIYASTLIYE
jgi:hypothetical protein